MRQSHDILSFGFKVVHLRHEWIGHSYCDLVGIVGSGVVAGQLRSGDKSHFPALVDRSREVKQNFGGTVKGMSMSLESTVSPSAMSSTVRSVTGLNPRLSIYTRAVIVSPPVA